MKKIICVHLYNDYSGSPLVLSTAVNGLLKKGKSVTLLSSGSKGFLSNLAVNKIEIPYRFHQNKAIRLVNLLINQWEVFCHILKFRKEDVVIYINTLLPFGAAIAGKLIGKEVIYHVHETSIRPAILKRFLKFIATNTAKKAIYVSKYLMKTESLNGIPGRVIPNALSSDFMKKANRFIRNKSEKKYSFTILMLCSLKKYKGVDQFVKLAENSPKYRFELVLNTSSDEINDYFDIADLPENLVIFPRQSDVHWFYQRAHLVLNLSAPNQWIETFGMTLLEGLSYGIPAIAPTIGGPTEIIQNGYNGYLINPEKLTEITNTINHLATNTTLYTSLSTNALQSAQLFQESYFQKAIAEIFTTKTDTSTLAKRYSSVYY